MDDRRFEFDHDDESRYGSMGRTSRFGSLGWRILLSMTLLALGPLIIMAYQGYRQARHAIIDFQAKHLQSVIDSRDARLRQWLTEIKAELTFSAAIPCTSRCCLVKLETVEEGMPANLCCILQNIGMHNCCFSKINTLDRNWNRLPSCRLQSKEVDAAIPMCDEFKKMIVDTETIVVSPPFRDESGQPQVVMGLRVKAELPENDTFIVAELTLATCLRMIFQDRLSLGETGKVYLLSKNGEVLAPWEGPDAKATTASYLPPDMLFSKQAKAISAAVRFSALTDPVAGAAGHSPVFLYDDMRGTAVLGASAVIPQLEWVIVAEIDRDEAFAWLGVLRTRALITGAITLALLILIAGWISRRLSRPMRELARVARSVAAGHLNERVGPLGSSDADEVGHAFNTMMDRLEASRARLQHASALAAVGELSTSMVHEMRNPLSSVKMNLQALRRKVEGDEAYAELADIAMNQAIRLEGMLTDLLNYGKPLELNPKPIEFEKVAADVKEVVRNHLDEKQVSLEIDNRLNGSQLFGDPEQIWRALTNLVVNAVQAVPEGGRVTLCAEKSQNESPGITLSVSDNGPGITPQVREQLFQPFFTTRSSGTGLGLANVKKIVEHHGGTIDFESMEGQGATFTMVLPCRENQA